MCGALPYQGAVLFSQRLFYFKHITMNEYKKFLKTKEKVLIPSGFENVNKELLNKNLFNFQLDTVLIALELGRFSLFFDCGLGKTIMFLAWSDYIAKMTNKPIIILSNLGIVKQTIKEGVKFGIEVQQFTSNNAVQNNGIYISNYEQLPNIDQTLFIGVVLDESSILKGKDGKLSNGLITAFKGHRFKLTASATPAPNDHLELGMHVEFLGYDSYDNMKAMFFIQDQKIKKSDKWRLRKHAVDEFWKYVCSWSMAMDNPKTLGYEVEGYDLPEIEYIEHIIPVENLDNTLFNIGAVSATDLHKDLKRSMSARLKKAAELVNSDDEPWIVWGLQNRETDELAKVLNDSINVQGSDKPQVKADRLLGFAENDFRVLISKTKIAGFGMNYQNCFNMLFCSYDFKFEAFFQGVRRVYRFGQVNKVKIHILVPESQKNVRRSILEKQEKHFKMIKQMAKYSADNDYKQKVDIVEVKEKEIKTDNFWLMNGDCVEEVKKVGTESIDYSFFSPPFSSLFTYSDDPKDFSNVKDDNEFFKHFSYLVPELFRILKKGRLVSMHVMQGTTSIGKDGFLSIKDLRGDLIRLFQSNGFYFHAEKMIRKNPQLAAVRTKNSQLMHGQTKRDSSINRPGLADYVITFRKPGKNEIPIQNDIPFDVWCKLAEPVWMDINEGDVIKNFRRAKGKNDEKHMTPTQLSVIRNCYYLWSNVGDTCFSPFGGVGSEGCQALVMDRKSINIELKKSYFNLNVMNHKAYDLNKKSVLTLF